MCDRSRCVSRLKKSLAPRLSLLHCNGLAMPDLKIVYRSGHALLITMYVFVFIAMVGPCLTLNLCIGRAMAYLTLYVFVYMLHCNGRAMPDLKFLCRSGHAWVNLVCVCLYASLQWSGHA